MSNKTQLPDEVVQNILKARDALVIGNRDEAYHQLYGIASPRYDSYFPWRDMELQIDHPFRYEQQIKEKMEVTAYAIRLHEAQQENEQLRRWKMEAVELLTKINSYAHKHLEIKLGECAVEFVIAQAKERDELKQENEKMKAMAIGWRPLLEEVEREDRIYGHVSGGLINKIKRFLYGE
jgi:hypothetical protein